MTKQKLWIATELFYPEETSTSFILSKIANRLASKYDITVLCGEAVYDTSSSETPAYTLNSDVKVRRIKTIKGNKNKISVRLLRFILLSTAFSWKLLLNTKKSDKVFIVTNPAPLLFCVSVLKRVRRFDLKILVHDVFPENTIPAGIIKNKKSGYYRILKYLYDWAYAQANTLIVLGDDMKNAIENKLSNSRKKPNIVIIPNWAEPSINSKKGERLKMHNVICIQYAGNLGRVQGLMEFLEIIKDTKNTNLRFEFVGDGALKLSMQKFVNENHLDNVSFRDGYRRNEQQAIINGCDLAVVTLSRGMKGLGVPSKTYNILAAGRPILYIGDKGSEIGNLVREKNIGFEFCHLESEKILKFLQSLNIHDLKLLEEMGGRARMLAENEYSEDTILNKFSKTI